MAVKRDSNERKLEMLKAIHGGKTIEELALEFDVSTTTIDNWRSELKDGLEVFDSTVTVDFGRRGKMDTTVHPIFLPANSSEIYTLLTVLMEYSRERGQDPKGIIARELAGKIHHQLTDYAKGLVDPNLKASGLGVPKDEKPDFKRDDKGGKDPFYLVMLEKSGAEIEVTFDAGRNQTKTAIGRISYRPAPAGCIRLDPTEASETEKPVIIQRDKILEVTVLHP